MAAYNGTASAGVEVSKNYLLLAPFYDVVTMASPRLNVTSVRPVERHDATMPYENAFAVTVMAVAPAAFVWLESQYPGASENTPLIHLAPFADVKTKWRSNAKAG